MTSHIFNLFFSTFILLLGIKFILNSYVKPDPFYSTTMKGYLGGAMFIFMSILSFLGKFSLYDTVTKLTKDSFKLKGENDSLSFGLFVAIVCSILFLTYYRPDKFLNKYRALKTNLLEKIDVSSNYLLFYFWFLFVIIYLSNKMLK